ncbi:hypothetical protein EUGRSUZ_J00763 [Eucalyptus grandis]|uniref:F-box/LRR-repeat protein 15-like leucin rich repeat domain-containing protein n=2 Tax=Eucalyptus grandis TaxID=71139 RepID=A0A059ABZ9_EUCGR|nr:hypothetical protein EUGRSUZ_J00763 [Eucalyptus grandis]
MALPVSLLVHDILLKLDLESLSAAACVSKILRSAAALALSSLPSLHLADFSPDDRTLDRILSACGGVTSLTVNCLRVNYRTLEGFLGSHIRELNLLCCSAMPPSALGSIGRKCPNLMVLVLEWAERGSYDEFTGNFHQMLSCCAYLESLCLKIRGVEGPEYAFSSEIWPKSIKVLKLQPALEDDVISLVKEIARNENWPEVIKFPSLPSICLLQSLSLHVRNISDKLVTTIAESMPCLLELELEDRPWKDPLPHGDLTNVGIQSLGSCDQLKSLSLSRNRQNCQTSFKRVNDMGIFLLSEGCKGLESVQFSGFSKVSDAGFASLLHSCKNLKNFEVRNSQSLSDLAFHDLAEAPCSLTELRILSCNLITSETVKKLAFSSKLEVLDLSGCRSIADSSFYSISSLKMLSTLDLAGADITDSGMSKLGQGSAPIQRLSLRGCRRVTDKGISQLVLSGGIVSKTLSSLDLGYMPYVSDKAAHAIATGGIAITELCIRSCFKVTDSSMEALARKGSLENGSRPIRRLDLVGCISLSVQSLQMLKKPLFRGLRWVGIGRTCLVDKGGSVLSEIYEERPWLTVCSGGCEMGCRDGWEYHGGS